MRHRDVMSPWLFDVFSDRVVRGVNEKTKGRRVEEDVKSNRH